VEIWGFVVYGWSFSEIALFSFAEWGKQTEVAFLSLILSRSESEFDWEEVSLERN